MKRKFLLTLLCAFICLFKTKTAEAQVTIFQVDTLAYSCKVPHGHFFNFWGTVAGTIGLTDSVTIKVNFGDGSDTVMKAPLKTTGTYGSYFKHDYTSAGSYIYKIKVTAPSGDSAVYTRPSAFIVSGTCATLSGHLYVDDNSNCVMDKPENRAKYVPMVVVNTSTSDTTFGGWTNDSGFYYIALLPGSYKILANYDWGSWWPLSWGAYGGITGTCPSGGSHSFTAAASTSYTKDFAFECMSTTSFDASALTSPRGGYFPGDTAMVIVWSGNWWYSYYGCASATATITLTLDSRLTYIGFKSATGITAPTSVSGGTITWTVPATYMYGQIYAKTSTSVTAADTICNTVNISLASPVTDPKLSNNTYVDCRPALVSFDPNNKIVMPKGEGVKGYIEKNTPLTYTINFQNTGTAPARTVIIKDDIEADLDIKSIHLLGATHKVTMSIENRTIKFRFDNINLPDSNTDYEGSMGAVTYGIMTMRDQAPGTEMTNKAGIYFDYNDPVITNEVLNTIKIPTFINEISSGSLKASVSPNPANQQLTVKTEGSNEVTVTVFDMLGRMTANEYTKTGSIVIDTYHMPAGLHVISIRDSKGNELNTKVMIQH